MDTEGRIVWQVAAGDTDRSYGETCLQWGVILNGPGYAGPWPQCRNKLADDGSSARKLSDIQRFAAVIKEGDIVVLRLGTSTALAVGEIVGPYEWNNQFGDIDGWDLQHIRRVRWLWQGLQTPMRFDSYDMKFGDTTQELGPGKVMDWIKSLDVERTQTQTKMPDLPVSDEVQVATVEEISEYLFDQGVASASVNTLTQDIGELVRIAKWYRRSSAQPSEHETIAYLVAPLLQDLGWTPQLMAIEWNYVDVALFSALPRIDDNLTVAVEAKRMTTSCLTAKSQAEDYALSRPHCKRLVVTDGLRYGIYLRTEPEDFALSSYLNLTELRRDYPVYRCAGAKEALLAMSREWKSP